MAPIVDRFGSPQSGRDGAIAQLGERVVRNDEVGGSIPPGSTSLRLLRKLRLGKPAENYRSEAAKAAAAEPEGRSRAPSDHSPLASLQERYPASMACATAGWTHEIRLHSGKSRFPAFLHRHHR